MSDASKLSCATSNIGVFPVEAVRQMQWLGVADEVAHSPTQRLAYISSLRLNTSLCSAWAQMEMWNAIGCRKWPFCLQQTNCQALRMKESLKMQLADVRAMRAMWVSGESDHGITDERKTHKTHQHESVCCRNKVSLALFSLFFCFLTQWNSLRCGSLTMKLLSLFIFQQSFCENLRPQIFSFTRRHRNDI